MKLSALRAAIIVFETIAKGEPYYCEIGMKTGRVLLGVPYHPRADGSIRIDPRDTPDRPLFLEIEQIEGIGLWKDA